MIDTVKKDALRWQVKTTVRKWTEADVQRVRDVIKRDPSGDEMAAFGYVPEVVEDVNNGVTTAGLTRITSLLTGGGGQAFTNTACRLGVGDSSTAFATSQTDLQAAAGATHRQFYVMDATYPQVSAGTMTFQSTFASADANFAWNEWCVDVGTPTVANGTTVNALMLNRKVASLGTKASGAWTLTVTITLA